MVYTLCAQPTEAALKYGMNRQVFVTSTEEHGNPSVLGMIPDGQSCHSSHSCPNQGEEI